jgi:hypothetical protein
MGENHARWGGTFASSGPRLCCCGEHGGYSGALAAGYSGGASTLFRGWEAALTRCMLYVMSSVQQQVCHVALTTPDCPREASGQLAWQQRICTCWISQTQTGHVGTGAAQRPKPRKLLAASANSDT